jgi:hypothetical protein
LAAAESASKAVPGAHLRLRSAGQNGGRQQARQKGEERAHKRLPKGSRLNIG